MGKREGGAGLNTEITLPVSESSKPQKKKISVLTEEAEGGVLVNGCYSQPSGVRKQAVQLPKQPSVILVVKNTAYSQQASV